MLHKGFVLLASKRQKLKDKFRALWDASVLGHGATVYVICNIGDVIYFLKVSPAKAPVDLWSLLDLTSRFRRSRFDSKQDAFLEVFRVHPLVYGILDTFTESCFNISANFGDLLVFQMHIGLQLLAMEQKLNGKGT